MKKYQKLKKKIRVFVNKYLFWIISYYIIALLITFGWQRLELLFYGEIQYRIVDDIIALILFLSILINFVFVRTMYISKANCDKYAVLDKEEYNSIQKNKYKDFYYILKTLENNLRIFDIVISNTIKNENGEKTNTVRFGSIKSFAQNMKCFNDLNIQYIEKELEKTKEVN